MLLLSLYLDHIIFLQRTTSSVYQTQKRMLIHEENRYILTDLYDLYELECISLTRNKQRSCFHAGNSPCGQVSAHYVNRGRFSISYSVKMTKYRICANIGPVLYLNQAFIGRRLILATGLCFYLR